MKIVSYRFSRSILLQSDKLNRVSQKPSQQWNIFSHKWYHGLDYWLCCTSAMVHCLYSLLIVTKIVTGNCHQKSTSGFSYRDFAFFNTNATIRHNCYRVNKRSQTSWSVFSVYRQSYDLIQSHRCVVHTVTTITALLASLTALRCGWTPIIP